MAALRLEACAAQAPGVGGTCRRWVYLAYIDSVKYFRPEDSAAAMPEAGTVACALRTLVYHELLLVYLAYIKARGFTSMFIWGCPPLQARPPARALLHATLSGFTSLPPLQQTVRLRSARRRTAAAAYAQRPTYIAVTVQDCSFKTSTVNR